MPSRERSRRELRNRAKLALWLALPFIGLMLLVSPRGEFPLNDDWVYAKMVQALAERGRFGLSPFSNAYALTQTLYAAPLVKLFGFSFTLLRLTSIFMGWITVCFTAFTARELGLPNRCAILAALTVFVNPLFINLSYTFMTDVPFCAFASIGIYYFIKTYRAPTNSNLLLGSLFSSIAFFNRQFGVLIPIAFVASIPLTYWVIQMRFHWRQVITIAIPWIAVFLILTFLPSIGPYLILPVNTNQSAWNGIYITFLFWIPILIGYIGIFLSPIVAALIASGLRRPRPIFEKVMPISVLLSLGAITFFVLRVEELVSYLYLSPPQIIRLADGFGISLVAFSFLPNSSSENWVPRDFTISVDPYFVLFCILLGIFFGLVFCVSTLLATNAGKVYRSPVRVTQHKFLLLLVTIMLVAPRIVMDGFYFDRYLLASLPTCVVLAATTSRRTPIAALIPAYFLLTVLGTISIAGLQDNMAWNTARWKAVDILRSKYSAHDNEINGGFEFNGMFTSEEYLRRTRDEPDTFKRKKWWVIGETFCVSPVDLTEHHNSYEILEMVPYYSWLGFETRYMYAMRLNPQP